MIPILNGLADLTIAWLSATLNEAGIPGAKHLRTMHIRSNPAFNSQVAHLELEFASQSSSSVCDTPSTVSDLPSSLLIKLNHRGDGEREVLFYQQSINQELPILTHCYAAQFDPFTGRSFLLLQDVSTTHKSPVSRQALLAGQGVPDQCTLIGIANAIARFHAAWWQRQLPGTDARLTAVRSWYADALHHARHVQRRQSELRSFFSSGEGHLSADTPSLLEHAVERLPILWERYIQPRVESFHQMTLTHGDCYLTQFLVPLQLESAPVYLIDFDSASGNFPAYDLVYLIPTFWSRPQRLENARELHFLQHYHTILCQSGVTNYNFADLCQDYRLMLCYMLFDAIADQVRGSPPSYWLPKLRCLVEAYQDWECGAL